jgi:hypothetical protein
MTVSSKKAAKWTCDSCGVSVSQSGGKRLSMPDSWVHGKDGTYCLICRRERAAQEALEAVPAECTLQERAKLRRAALIEFEVRRQPNHSDGAIAKTCRASVSAVAAARQRLQLPAAPAQRRG